MALWIPATAVLAALPLAAGTMSDPGANSTGSQPGFPITLPPDYSWTQLYSFDDAHPGTLDDLTRLVNGLGPGTFLQTGNSAFNYQGITQLLLVGNSSGPSLSTSLNPATINSVTNVNTPEPASFALLAIGVILLAGLFRSRVRLYATVKIQELRRR